MLWKQKRDQWLEQLPEEDPVRKELVQQISDEKQMEDSFYKDLEFGTGGMRGVIGPGTNRMNVYTVRKAALGLAQYIVEQGKTAMERGVAIAYDSRHISPEFALEVAKTVGSQGIRVYLFEELRPTPVLSFAIRHLQALRGVVITASHNPPEYNGLKVYGEDGAQLPPNAADVIIGHMNELASELTIEVANKQELIEQGNLTYIGEAVDQAYIEALQTIQLNKESLTKDLSIVFTALHGTGNEPVRNGLAAFGFNNVTIVKEQALPDPNFQPFISESRRT